MSVAAQTMAWQRRMHNRPGPLAAIVGPTGGSGEQPTGLPQVELYLGGWIDMTALGLVRYAQGIKITRGQPDETQNTNPSTASFRLNNKDGRFSPRNPLGPYYGVIDKNTPCRISVQSGDVKSYRFYGEVSSWPASWDPTGNDSWVDIQASGILRRLNTGKNPVRSAPYAYWVNAIAGQQAVAYWPMEDGSSATQFASGIAGGNPMGFSGSPSLAASSTIVPSDPLPTFTTGTTAAAGLPVYTPAAFGTSSATLYVIVPSGGETAQTLVSFGTTGSLTWELYYSNTSGGELGFRGRDNTGAVKLDTGLVAFAVNGVPVVVGLDIEQADASNVFADITVQSVTSSAQGFAEIEGATYTAGRFTQVTISPTGTLTGTTIGHLAISTAGGSAPIFNYQGRIGESAAVRFGNLCTQANIPYHIVFSNVTFDTGPAMGPLHSGTLITLLQECVDVDQGIMFELMNEVGLGYRCRDTILNQTGAVCTLDYPSSQLVQVPAPVDDDTFTRNSVTVTRLNGSYTLAQQLTGPCNLQTPPTGVGEYDTSVTENVEFDSQTADAAGWRLHLGTVAEPRYPTIGMQLSRSEITSSSTLRQSILSVMPGDRVVVTNPPAWLPPDPISELAIGYSETIDQFLHAITWNTRPESPWRVAVADDAVLGHADTDGSTLAAPAQATDTTVSVATTNPASPLWTTNAGDFPFDIAVGGERMTVTNITGSSSPQTFTVTRSVNGVVKPQAQNTTVQLWQPATVGM